jgi:hypothetical protein
MRSTARRVGSVYANPPESATPPAELMIFGGENHKTYLGCLNCPRYSQDSIYNQYGEHGSRYSTESIWNSYSECGSRYSNYGVCNPYATDPPVIVDANGHYYGRLTMNRYHAQLGDGASFIEWLATNVCQN